MKRAEFKWEPLSVRQTKIMNWWTVGSPYRDYDGIIADGAIRSGKTISMGFSFVMWAMENYNRCDFGMAGKTVGTLRRNVIGTLKRQLRAEGYNVQERRSPDRMIVGCGNRVNTFYLFGGKDESSQDLIQGATLAGMFFDEVALMPESFVNQATARCSVDGSKFWFNCNPAGPQHWFYQKWILGHREKNLVYLHFTMADNLTLSAHIRKRYEGQYKGVFYDRYIRGLWVMAEGIIYDMFDAKKHVIPADQLPKTEGPYYVASDYGISNANVWKLYRRLAGTNKWLCLKESYYSGREQNRRKTDDELLKLLMDMLGGIRPEKVIIDPSAASMIMLLRKNNFTVLSANNDVLPGISDVSTMLTQERLLYSSECKRTIEEFGLYCWDEKKAEHGEDAPIKTNDHAMDTDRYFVRTMRLVTRNESKPYVSPIFG